MIPQYWTEFLDNNDMNGAEVEIPPDKDLSQIDDENVGLYILSAAESIEEATKYYPGIGVKPHGYIPVAGCQLGTGDPYFINSNDGKGGPLYRIYHDRVLDENYNKNEAIDIVLNNYEDLLKYKTT